MAANCPSGKVLIVEPEYKGSLLYDVHEAMPDKMLRVSQVAFPREIFRNYGTYDEKMNYYGLNAATIEKKLHELIG